MTEMNETENKFIKKNKDIQNNTTLNKVFMYIYIRNPVHRKKLRSRNDPLS